MEAQILKYLKGELDDNEKLKMIKWVGSDSKNQRRFNVLKAEYIASKLKDLSDEMDSERTSLLKRI